MDLNAKIVVLAVGIPALLIVLGFFRYLQEELFSMFGLDISGFGKSLIALGVAIYVVELLLGVYIVLSEQSQQNTW